MSIEFNLEVPDRKNDEEDSTKKQRSFIYQLCSKIGLDREVVNAKSLGIEQASALIDQLILLRDSKAEVLDINNSSKPSIALCGLIFIFPYVFSWFSLHPKYSVRMKIISFTWLFWMCYIMYDTLKV